LPGRFTNGLLFAFAGSAALLWVALIPLWDGFDEAHHYSYIQSLRSDFATLRESIMAYLINL
jgi:hypothetical protein